MIWVGTLFLAVVVASAPASAALFFTQAPCVARGTDYCKIFYSYSATRFVVRSLAFNLPRAGRAEVTFHGTMTCTNSSGSEVYFDLGTQIVGSATADVIENGPGGLRHAANLEPPGGTITPAVTFNLASNRIIAYPSGGRKTLYFKIEKLRMDAATSCKVYNAVFSVEFDP
jgi:hypothetical protein